MILRPRRRWRVSGGTSCALGIVNTLSSVGCRRALPPKFCRRPTAPPTSINSNTHK